jgi:hypothetical protein
VANASQSDFAPFWSNAILDFEVATLHSHFDAIAGERQNATLANCRFAGKRWLR